jgi:hypothetical protein
MATPTWDGKGVAPSKEAARQWAISQGVDPTHMPYAWTDKQNPGNPQEWSDAARELVGNPATHKNQPAQPAAAPTQTSPAPASSTGSTPSAAPPGSLQALIAAGPNGGAANAGYPLLPYTGLSGSATSAFPTTSPVPGATNKTLYTETNLLDPLSWSPEKIAALQQQMMNVGLYGHQTTTLGKWNDQDLHAYKLLLTGANVAGKTSDQQLAEWAIRPPTPTDIKGLGGPGSGSTAIIQLTNPTDVRAAAETVSQNLIGHVDPNFVNSAPAAYNATEQAAGDAQVADQASGQGGTVTQEASAPNFLADKLQREQPLAVDANSFINTFDNFRKMLGAQ